MGISAKEAAERVGISKQGIIRAIHKGRLSAMRNEHGEFVIDPAELFRVYQPVSTDTPKLTAVDGDDTAYQIKSLQERVSMLERMIDDKDDMIQKLDDTIQKLLDKIPTPQPTPPQIEDKQRQPSWWQRWLGHLS